MTSNGFQSDGEDEVLDSPFAPGWWLGSDGNWRTLDERFDPPAPKRNHPVRRLLIVILAIVLIGATSAGVWGGATSQPTQSFAGPSLSSLNTQVQLAVAGNGRNGFGVTGVVRVVCDPPAAWRVGHTFTCYVYGSAQKKLGVYNAKVESTMSSGEWRWTGVWNPNRRHDSTTV